jgi:hypothetical protein
VGTGATTWRRGIRGGRRKQKGYGPLGFLLRDSSSLPLLARLHACTLRTLRAVDVIGVAELMLTLLLFGEVLPIGTLLSGKRAPLVADEFRQIRLALLLYGCASLNGGCLDFLCVCVVLDALATEENEGVLWALDVVLIALLWSAFAVEIDFKGTANRLASLDGN